MDYFVHTQVVLKCNIQDKNPDWDLAKKVKYQPMSFEGKNMKRRREKERKCKRKRNKGERKKKKGERKCKKGK